MNSLEAEYSFLAPTWKLPTVATTSMYAPTYGASYSPNAPDLGPDWSLWNNTTYNSRYIPSYVPSVATRRNHPILTNYQPPGGRSIQSDPPHNQQSNNSYKNNSNSDDGLNSTVNGYGAYNNNMPNYGSQKHPMSNRGLTYATHHPNNLQQPPPPPHSDQKRRVKIIDHNRHTPSTVVNDYAVGRQSHNSTYEPPVSHQNYTSEATRPPPKPNASIANHYGHDHRRVVPAGNNLSIHEYLYGLAEPDPGSYANAFKHQQRRLQDEKQGRKSVGNDYRAFAQNGGFGPTFGNTDYQSYEDKVVSTQKKKTYARAVKENNQQRFGEQKRSFTNGQQKNYSVPVPKYQRSHLTKPHFLLIRKAREYADKIERPQNLKPVSDTESSTNSSILIKSLSNTPRRSSIDSVHSLKMPRRVRFRSRDFIRRRSSTMIDLPSHIIGKGIPTNQSVHDHTKKSSLKQEKSSNFFFPPASNKNEKKSIISHSMITAKNMRLPPTATVVINPTLTAITHSKKSTTNNRELLPSQRQLSARSIPAPYRKSTIISEPDFDLKIKSFHHNNKSILQ